jgi:carbonic anhydrase/acetyltransferase-like protein (isoleucine patch superfamily)
MLVEFDGKRPQVAPTAWIGPGSYVLGDVVIGERSTVWPGAVIRGDFAPIRIGDDVHVEDSVVLHSGGGLTIGNNVTIGHGAVVHCRSIGSFVLLANNSTVLDDAVVEDDVIVAANALVAPRTHVPTGSIVMGVPGVITPAREDQLARRRAAQASRTDGGYFANAMRYRAAGIEERQFFVAAPDGVGPL